MQMFKTLLCLNYITNIRRTMFMANVLRKKNSFSPPKINNELIFNSNIKFDDYFILEKDDICAKVIIIPMFKDNYSYIFYEKKEEGIVVDPSDYSKVQKIAEKENINIHSVLCTHKHHDHNGGNKYFIENGVYVYGIKEEGNIFINKNILNIKQFQINNFILTTFISNFHANNHISYLVKNTKNNLKQLFFTGDFLFLSGIGRNFEKKNEDLYNSIKAIDIIEKNKTYVFCGHEYTLANLQFALTVDPDNTNLRKYYEQMQQIRKNKKPSIPSLLEQEYLYNPFLRYHQDAIKKSIENYARNNNIKIQNKMDYLVILRIMKDHFMPA